MKPNPLHLITNTEPKPRRAFPHDPERRGLVVVYRRGNVNHCPGCGMSNWLLGRMSAECGRCGTTLDYSEAGR